MTVIDSYLQTISQPEAAELERIRMIVLETVPAAQEVISYGMPGFKYKGKYLLGMNAFKDHLSLFPTGGPVDALKAKLGNYKISKGTIQFTLENPLPKLLIQEIVAIRVADIKGKNK
jgi:uncharacterized protein YdhG (YjbR/CyaY superfamily)